jgi:adenylate kinase family enzyme
MPLGRMRASVGIAEPHWVQNAAGGVERWQVGHRISPGLGVAMTRALCLPAAPIAREHRRVPSNRMRRINVVGTSCSGKTTLARALARRLDMPHVELDALFWGADWTPVSGPEFRSRLAAALDRDRWVADGGYAAVRDITWARVDTIVWLDFPMRIVLARWARRTVARIASKEEFWPGTGNRESVVKAFRRDGLIWWILRTHHRRRHTFGAAMRERTDLRWIRLRSPDEAARWLTSIQASAISPATTAGASASAQNP